MQELFELNAKLFGILLTIQKEILSQKETNLPGLSLQKSTISADNLASIWHRFYEYILQAKYHYDQVSKIDQSLRPLYLIHNGPTRCSNITGNLIEYVLGCIPLLGHMGY